MGQSISVSKIITLILGVLLYPLLSAAQQDLHYDLRVNASLAGKTFSVKGTLSFLAGPDATDAVAITLSKCSTAPSIRLKHPSPDIVSVDTSTNTTGDFVYRFRFRKKLRAGSRLEFAYHYERGAEPAFQYYMDSTFCMAGGYGAAWYPQVLSRMDDSTEKYTRGTAVIRVTLPQPLVAVMAAATRTVTANAPTGTYEFHYTTPDIFSLYIGAYRRQEVKGAIPFYYFSLGPEVDAAALSAKGSEVLAYLVSLFGRLTIPDFSVIEFPDAVSERTGIGGASIMGGIVMPASALKRFNYALFGHEFSHQWWGNKVLSRGDKGAQMLSEGLAQYGSLQVVQHFDSAHALLYRKTGYPGYISDQCGFGYLKNAAAGIDAPLSQLNDANGHTIGASKGFLVLELLSNTVGKETFHKTLQHIGDQYNQSGISWQDFLKEMETAHGSSLQWFYRQWFDRTGVPAWQIAWQQQQNELLLTVTQTDSTYRLPLEVLVTYTSGESILQQISVQERETQVQLPVSALVTAVQVDPFFKVIHWDEALKPMARELSKVQRVQQLRIEQKHEGAEKLALSYLQAGFPEDHYGAEFSLLYNLARIKGTQGKEEEALAYYQEALRCATRFPDLLAYTYYRIAQIARRKKDQTLFRWACDQAVKADVLNDGKDDMQAKINQLKTMP
jgi:hypothetical protein